METIDCKGLSCPEPVVATKKALKAHPEGCIVIVDDRAASENVPRFAKASGYKVEESFKDGEWTIKIEK